jgi:uncharacterized membrane protein
MNKKKKLNRLVICAFFVALTVVMTFTPLGYIPVGVISITTIHISTILGACILGPKYGMVLGGAWGALCIIKAFQEPIPGNIPFQNPMISLVPRIIVGLVAGAFSSMVIAPSLWAVMQQAKLNKVKKALKSKKRA